MSQPKNARLWSFLRRDIGEFRIVRIVGVLVVLYSAGAALVGAYQVLNHGGWIAHSRDTPVWIQGDWLVGEFRECNMLTTTPFVDGEHYSPEELAHLPRLFCNSGVDGYWKYASAFEGTDASWQAVSKDFHTLPVKYFGRLERPGKWLVSWRCQRKDDSLTCKALN
jgi:hypothetical protein